MIDWRQGGWTGSINRWVRREVHEHLRSNVTALSVRYGLGVRILRWFSRFGTFGRLFGLYLAIDLLVVATEAFVAKMAPGWLPAWTASGTPGPDIKALVLNVSSYLVSTQVGLLSVVSLALALVTLVSQRENSSTDVQLYYHESLSFELVASCMALLAVLCIQLLWPLQFLLHRFEFGTGLQVFKLFLLGLHLVWLLVNLGAAAYFITTTFRFVQQSARERLRERYTANVVLPREMTARLRRQLYGLTGNELVEKYGEEERGRSSVAFGFDFGKPNTIEVETDFAHPSVLYDVRLIWVRWVIRRWMERSVKLGRQAKEAAVGLPSPAPVLWFTPHLDRPMHGRCGWCRRRDGVPLTSFEKFLLRRAFRFRRSSDDA